MERRSSVDVSNKESNNANGKTEATEYIPARCRITRPTPPKPAQNPLQFVKVGPCDLYRSAQEQLKKVEVIKKIKQEFKEDGEDWQANLDNWKSSRRKRQEHIIERVVEIRNMEQESEKARRRSKTFSEILEERNSRRRKLSNLALYAEDDGNDLADLGISSRKGSISGESNTDEQQPPQRRDEPSELTTEPISNDTASEVTTVPTPSEEYTYESAIQDYKSRVKRRSFQHISDFQTDSKPMDERRTSLFSFQTFSNTSGNESSPAVKPDLPKIDISERKQLFESSSKNATTSKSNGTTLPDELSHSKSIKERLQHLEKCTEESLNIKKATKLLTGDIMTVRDRLSSLVANTGSTERNNNLPTWSSTEQLDGDVSTKEQCDDNQLIKLCHMDKARMFHCSLDSLDMRHHAADACTLGHVQSLDALDCCATAAYPPSGSSTELLALSQCGDTDREDSGIQTADVSCSVSQADDPDDDSDTMAAINSACVEQHLDKTPTLKSYLSNIEPQDTSTPTSPSENTDVASTATTKSESSVVEELITCTINVDMRNKLVFDEPLVNLDPLLAPPRSVEPPKEKPPPPPPPTDAHTDDEQPTPIDSTAGDSDPELRRLNSTKRIKNELRSKRSSFLGIEEGGGVDMKEVELLVSRPPDAATILQEELQMEKEMYRQSQQMSHDVESRDSGVELEAKEQRSNVDEDEISKKEREIIENLEKEEQWRYNQRCSLPPSYAAYSRDIDKNNELRYGDDEDVIRVERELLELEQEELERQREDLFYQSRKASLLAKQNTVGLPEVYPRVYNFPNYYQQSAPSRPLQLHAKVPLSTPLAKRSVSVDEHLGAASSGPMSRHTLHALSATPKSKLMNTDSWIQSQPMKKAVSSDYNQHWLIQEAEDRRLSEHYVSPRGTRPTAPTTASAALRDRNYLLNRKDVRGPPLWSSVDRSGGVSVPIPAAVPPPPPPPPPQQHELLSVSGKKKCSHCGDELGRGAAMIIESLCLFYHMDCFKCCVCHVQLGDGLMGTDVRVRNHKLHCHNCYSSDDGVKFSCV